MRRFVWSAVARGMRPSAVLMLLSAIVLSGGCNLFPNPEVASVEPNHGPPTGGTEITIIGSALEAPVAVTLNDVAASNLQLIHSRALTVVTPPGNPGPATLALIFADGSVVTIPDAFTYDEEELSTAELPLTLTAITPAVGPVTGGTRVTVQGTNFVPEAVLLIGGQPALDFTYVGPSLLTATTPPGTVGVASVVLNTGDGRSTDYPPGFEYLGPDSPGLPQPTITAVSPKVGPQAGGTTVTVQGTLFEPGSVVVFDDVLAIQTSFVSSTILTAVAPAHRAGLSAVSVALPDARRATLADAYEFIAPPSPAISTIMPANGPIAGGTAVTIQGRGFTADARVFFDHTAALSVEVLSAQSLVAVTPPHAEGAVDVAVQLDDGSEGTAAGGFMYLGATALVVDTIDPAHGPAEGGTEVTLVGQGFTPGAAVLFGLSAATEVTFFSSEILTAVAPPQRAGTVVVLTVSLPDGQRYRTIGTYTYDSPATLALNSMAPMSGPKAGGTQVTISGTGFVSGMTVTFGGSAAAVTVLSDTLLTAITPAGEGIVEVRLETPDLQSASGTFEYVGRLATISGLSPSSGPEVGGTIITISGTGLSDILSVKFDDVDARFMTLSDTQVLTLSPPGTGIVPIIIATPISRVASNFTYVPSETASIGSFSPASGAAAGGTILTIIGTGLGETSDVLFGSTKTPAVYTILSDTQLQVLTPPSEPGTVLFEIQTPHGTPSAMFTYVTPGLPTISELTPAFGPDSGGTVVTIEGTGFTETIAVTFGGTDAPAIAILSDTLIQAVTPSGAAGNAPVEVLTSYGTAYALFTYVTPATLAISAIDPATGPEDGGAVVTITGTNLLSVTKVTFGFVAASFLALSDQELQAVAPPGTGVVPIVISNGEQVAFAEYTYIPPTTLSIISIEPDSGFFLDNTIVTISGTGLSRVTEATIDSVPTGFLRLGDDSLQVVAPAHLPATVTLTITDGIQTASAYFTYTVIP